MGDEMVYALTGQVGSIFCYQDDAGVFIVQRYVERLIDSFTRRSDLPIHTDQGKPLHGVLVSDDHEFHVSD